MKTLLALFLMMLSVSAQAQTAPCVPVPIATPAAPFPAWASRRGITGVVYFQFRIAANGSVAEVHALQGSKSEFISDTLATVKTWKFKALKCNQPEEGIWQSSEMTFRLTD
jgi:TonB family protein